MPHLEPTQMGVRENNSALGTQTLNVLSWFRPLPGVNNNATTASCYQLNQFGGIEISWEWRLHPTSDYSIIHSPYNAYNTADQTILGADWYNTGWEIITPIPTPIHLEPQAPSIIARPVADNEISAKARRLLDSLLTPEQREEYKAHEHITLCSKSGRRYRLLGNVGRARNIRLLGNGHIPKEVLCAHPIIDLPIEDVLAAQLLHLMHDEEEFRRIANIQSIPELAT